MSAERFDELVSMALDTIPAEISAQVDNLVVLVEDDPPEGSGVLLGLYEGIPLTSRDHWYAGVGPDRITIFRNPLLSLCDDEMQIIDEVRITVVHEVAHHFGIDDDRLHELGYG